ncbi:hypothetical protein Daus18300_000816 [Diaporthe australafricana]|uniref:Uncharacterized protein n=1 Tax=Diaporthe australafricana TaxID=127596 RepID=A0ABR3Y137_9PEZI
MGGMRRGDTRQKAARAAAAAEDTEMQMNTEVTPPQDPVVQVVANRPPTTLHLDFGGVTGDGQHFITSILQCGNPEEVAHKTVGSIGTVNIQLQRHEREIGALMDQGVKNERGLTQVAKEIRDEMADDKGNVVFCRRSIVEFKEGLEAAQKEIKTLKDANETLKDAIETLKDANETLQKEMKAQYLVMQNVVKEVIGNKGVDITQASPPKSYPQEQLF